MRTPVVMITGASGEIGHALITRLSKEQNRPIITLDLRPLSDELKPLVLREINGSILDGELLDRVLAEYEVELIFHLAALLSTRCEFSPVTAHRVNVEGTMSMLDFAQKQGESHGHRVLFLYPSSIAAYGLPDLATKANAGKVTEDEYNKPTTIYGCNKLYCEHIGRYYWSHYKQLAAQPLSGKVDFRCLRFPGLISAVTIPSGGTSDYASEMIHAAAKNQPYACFVRPDTRITFMAMPDSVQALLRLARASRDQLTRTVYNVGAFNPSAEEIQRIVQDEFPHTEIATQVDEKRQGIVDSWPEDVDDSAAREEWGFRPEYDLERAFQEYLIPTIRQRYAS
ncbi:MAG: NAD-dependent epimerase/dehydratase family protein [Gemmataceae bacterium]